MKKFLVLLKKEIKELITIQMVLPLIITVAAFGLVGNLLSKETAKISQPQAILILNQDVQESGDAISETLKAVNFQPSVLRDASVENAINQAKQNKIVILMVIPPNFKKNINSFKLQEIAVYKLAENFSVISNAKYSALDRAMAILNTYYSNQWIEKEIANISPEQLKNPIRANEFVVIKDRQANAPLSLVLGQIQKQTTFIPMILFFVIIVASQMVATAIANEKENKTFEILLSSPINRKTIILAKLIAAGLVALLFTVVYLIGFNYYFKGIFGNASSTGVDLTEIFKSLGIIINPLGYLLLALTLFMSILVGLAISMILGLMAESVKSVQAVTTPLMILVLLPYFLALLVDIGALSPVIRYLIYAIPFSHAFLASQNIILGNYSFVLYGIIYQFIIFMVFVIISIRIFSSDKAITLKIKFGKKK
jgi:ABC-2 type transport system permease protein